MTNILKLTTAAILLSILTSPAQATPEFAIPWYEIGSSGQTSTGGSFKLTSTIGQPDGNSISTGGTFKLVGGFLHGTPTTSGMKDWVLY